MSRHPVPTDVEIKQKILSLFACDRVTMEKIISCHLLVKKSAANKKVAAAMARQLVECVITRPHGIYFGLFYKLGTSEPQCEVHLAGDDLQIQLLGGIDEDTGNAYLVSEAAIAAKRRFI